MADQQTPLAITFLPSTLDTYLDFSKGTWMGLDEQTPFCIPDLPPVKDEDANISTNQDGE